MSEPAVEQISFPRWWVQRICDDLHAVKNLPRGSVGDWVFLFREQLKDKLARTTPLPDGDCPECGHNTRCTNPWHGADHLRRQSTLLTASLIAKETGR
jgi:hypothetical protein